MLFWETVAVYCEKHTEHQETHYVSVTKPNRLMLFTETVPGYCENHTENTNTMCRQRDLEAKAGGTYHDHYALKV
jgi:hypothetical protein